MHHDDHHYRIISGSLIQFFHHTHIFIKVITMIDQFYDANGDGAFSEVHTATEEAGHLTAHDARWVKQ